MTDTPKFTAHLTPYSSVVGQSVGIMDETGKVVALLSVHVPNPSMDYEATAKAIAKAVVDALNRQQ